MAASSKPLSQAVRALADSDDCVRVFERELDYVYRTLRRLGATPIDAEDLCQEVFLVVWRRRREWDPRRSLRPWLAAIAFRVMLAHSRRKRREVPGGFVDDLDRAPPVEDRMATADARRLVLEILTTLPPRQRVVLVLHEIDEIPMREIAGVLKVPLFTAYTRLRAAHERFARELRRRQLGASIKGGQLALLPDVHLAFQLERTIDPAPRALAGQVMRRLADAPAHAPFSLAFLAGAGAALPLRQLGRVGLLVAAGIVVAALAGLTATARESTPGASARTPDPAPSLAVAEVSAVRPGRSAVRSRTLASRTAGGRAAGPSVTRQLGQGLAAYWRFDESRGTPGVRDATGHGSDCVLRRMDSTERTEGALGGALRLKGGGWVECAPGAGLRRIAGELTVSAWVWRDQHQKNLRTIVARQDGTGEADDIYLGLVGNQLLFSSRAWGRVAGPVPWMLGRWFHVAVAADRGLVRLYLDGREIARAPAGPRPSTDAGRSPADNALLMGAAVNGFDPSLTDQKLNGALDEVLIYDRGLGAEEIRHLAAGVQPHL